MKILYMDFSPFCIRSAYVIEGSLVEFFVDSFENKTLTGNIYSARIKDITKGQFAFCDIGHEKNGFLQLNDFRQRDAATEIKKGNQIIVQVLRDAAGGKGPYLTTEITFTGKNIILVKTGELEGYTKLSKKIIDEGERRRLKAIGNRATHLGYGIIIRTSAVNATEDEIINEIKRLSSKANEILEKGKFIKAPAHLKDKNKLYEKSLLAILDDNPDKIIVNSKSEYESIKKIAKDYSVYPSENIEYYQRDLPIFDAYSIANQVSKVTHNHIWLKSGAFLLIEEAAACSFIDVNSGKFSGKKTFEDSAHFVNMEAAKEICRQIRLKNISGFILVDFINTKVEENSAKLMELFKSELQKDRNPAIITDWSGLNIVSLTRKKSRPPLLEIMTDKCPHCNGSGKIMSKIHCGDNIYKDIKRLFSGEFYDTITIKANKNLIAFLKEGLEREFFEKNSISFEIIDTFKRNYYEIAKEKKEHIHE